MNEEQIKDKGPKLSRGMKIFIIVGTILVAGFFIVYFSIHGNDPDYLRTQIEPDSTLADKELVIKQDTAKQDTAAVDSANEEEQKQAAKVYNSIRGNNRHKTADDADDNDEADESADESKEQSSDATSTTEKSQTPSQPKSETSPTVESVE